VARRGVARHGVARRGVARRDVEQPEDIKGGATGRGVRLGVEDVDGDVTRGATGGGVGDVNLSVEAEDAKVDVKAMERGVDATHADEGLEEEDGADCAFFLRLSIKRLSADMLNLKQLSSKFKALRKMTKIPKHPPNPGLAC
jgi:hypothetical protein